MREKRFIQVSKLSGEVPVSKHTLYEWHIKKRFPEIFVKIGRMLCVDIDSFYRCFSPDPDLDSAREGRATE